ncbi:hypothetical protein LU293_07320 [Moraxella nasovis]|nr:hypothetical protein [Moraxella nasovis]UNU72897.1 hypothetical protein LU293_07320 [Moraxella nasovis]
MNYNTNKIHGLQSIIMDAYRQQNRQNPIKQKGCRTMSDNLRVEYGV